MDFVRQLFSEAVLVEIVIGLALMLVLVLVQDLIFRRFSPDSTPARLLVGALFGVAAIAGMASPMATATGNLWDPRAVILSVGALFGGPIVAAVATSMAAFYFAVTDPGALPNIIVGAGIIVSSALIGLGAYYLRRRWAGVVRPVGLLALGLATQLASVAAHLLVAGPEATWAILPQLLPALIMAPVATLVLGRLMIDREERAKHLQALDESNIELSHGVEMLERRAQFDAMFADILTELTGSDVDQVDAAIERALARFATYVDVDYSFVTLLDAGGQTWSVTNTWQRPGYRPMSETLRSMQSATTGWIAARVLTDEVVAVGSLAEIPAGAVEEVHWLGQLQVQSILQVPVKGRHEEVVGSIGLLSVRGGIVWNEDHVRLTRLLGSAIANTLERRHAERARLEARQDWERTFDAAQDGIAIIDRNMRIRRLNDAMARRFQCSKEECEGTVCSLLGGCNVEGGGECPHKASIDDGMPHSAEVTDVRTGNIYSVTASPLRDERGIITGSVYVSHDVTRRRQIDMHMQELAQDVEQAQISTIFALAKLAESRDDSTGRHLECVQALCRLLATQLRTTPIFSDRIDDVYVERLASTSALHDVGKVGVPDSILLKPGRLTPGEFEIAKTHTVIGANTLAAVRERHPSNEFIRMGIQIARSHHERWDGRGYPDGLAGEHIPLSARIMAIADVYEALRSVRCYKDAVSHAEAVRIIRESSGTQFDPALVQAFELVAAEFERCWSSMKLS